MSGDERTTMATLDGGDGGGEGGLIINTTLSLASRLNKRADLLRRIFSFHETRNPSLDYIDLRSSSKLFHRALHQPPPLWTSFPHSHTDHQTMSLSSLSSFSSFFSINVLYMYSFFFVTIFRQNNTHTQL